MEIKSPEYSYVWLSQEERKILRDASGVLLNLFDEGEELKRGEDFKIECYDSCRELEGEYSGVDIYDAYLMICELSHFLKYYPDRFFVKRVKEENKNGN